jgi:hypothetical protein
MTEQAGKRRWRVRLKGESQDLADLAALFTSPTLRVVQEGEEFFLESASFEPLDDSATVHSEAQRIMPRLNGAARLRERSFRNVATDVHVIELTDEGGRRKAIVTGGGITPRGQVRHRVIAAPTLQVGARLFGPGIVREEEKPSAPEPGSLDTDRWIELSGRDADVAEVLSLSSIRPPDWVNLYKVLKIIQGRADVVGSGWASREALDRFTRTANHPVAAGRSARHARSNVQPPPKPMTLEEGDEFISRVLVGWLKSLL